ncbi:MAG: nitroreductase family protein [Pseudomonadota bacterium]
MQYDILTQILAARFSCRAFRPDPVAHADIERIVSAARHAPSWCNAQPWQLEITRGAETDRFRAALRAEVEAAAPTPDLDWPTGYTGIYKDRRRACGWQLYEAVGVEKGDRIGSAKQMMRNYDLFDAPHVAIVTSPAELGPYGAMDCGGFVTAFALAAQALGVATIPQAAVAAYGPMVRRHFGIPDDRLVLCAISFGYAERADPANSFRTDRAEVAEIVAWHG